MKQAEVLEWMQQPGNDSPRVKDYIMTLTETEANILFDILVKHAGHNDNTRYDRSEFLLKFTDPERQHGEYWFSGKFNDFKLLETIDVDGFKRWHMIKQGGQPYRNSPIFKALNDTNKALKVAYDTKALSGRQISQW